MPPEVDAGATLIAGEEDAFETGDTDDAGASAGPGTSGPTTVRAAHLDADARGAAALVGRLIAERYRLVDRLGEGAHGEVWVADDRVLRGPVALKWMRSAEGPIRSRIRREITTLRMLRVPGVVRLLDDGVEDDRPFLVMERIDGRPFPGAAAARPGTPPRYAWTALADPTLALLEVLARVHAAGVVHRDLKPDNILVSADGRPTVLDFGISLWSDPASDRLTGAGQILGTPLYIAPEQILGRSIDPRTDLYSVGVMLYRSLAGRLPHEARDIQAMLRARLIQPATPVRDVAPDVPAIVAGVIDRLLATRIEDRPRSATEVLAMLRGQPTARVEPVLPRLGGGRPVEAALEAARAGRSVSVLGGAGSGRSRCLADAAAALEREGRTLLRTRPSRVPLASLQPIVDAQANHGALGLAEMTTRVEAQLRASLAEGAIVLADDAEQLDPWSAAVIERCRRAGGVIVRAQLDDRGPRAAMPADPVDSLTAPANTPPEEIVRLEPLDEAALRPLFAGPDRLFHLREDAARMLWERTQGLPLRIEAEVTLWARLGLSRWSGALLTVDREALDRLSAGLPGAAPPSAGPGLLEGEPHLQELLRWLALAGQHLELGQLTQVIGEPAWRIEAECDALVGRGLARRLPGQRVVPNGQVDVTWSADRRLQAHRGIAAALRPGQEGRLFHLLAADEARAATRESVVVAERRASEGRLGAAAAALGEGLRVLRQQPEEVLHEEEGGILEAWVEVAFAEGTPRALDRVMYELTRATARGATVDRLEALVRAGIAATGASGPRALDLADHIPPFSEPRLERRRHRVRIMAAAARSWLPLVEEVLDEVDAWASQSGEPMARLCLAEGMARLRYGQGRFEQAAALHAEAAERDPWLTGRIAATLNGASALLDAFRHREAAERAAAARELAAECRHAAFEGRAEWLLRAAHYRMGMVPALDRELVEAAAQAGAADLEALLCLNEAAIAFRAGEMAIATELTGRAAQVWREMDRTWGLLLARCLALRCGAQAAADEVRSLAEQAAACPVPGVGAQALGLLGEAFPEERHRWRDIMTKLVEGIPRSCWSQRMDVLSVDEALEGTR